MKGGDLLGSMYTILFLVAVVASIFLGGYLVFRFIPAKAEPAPCHSAILS